MGKATIHGDHATAMAIVREEESAHLDMVSDSVWCDGAPSMAEGVRVTDAMQAAWDAAREHAASLAFENLRGSMSDTLTRNTDADARVRDAATVALLVMQGAAYVGGMAARG